MEFIQVKYADICRINPTYKLEAELTAFIRMEVKAVEVPINGHYSSARSAHETLRVAAKRYGMPILVTTRKGKVYLIRTDI